MLAAAALVLLAAVPAALGLLDNPSFSEDLPVRVPDREHPIEAGDRAERREERAERREERREERAERREERREERIERREERREDNARERHRDGRAGDDNGSDD